MRPLAPGLFSTTTGWPNLARSPSATSRAERSVMPAGGNGTIKRIGREGKDCAAAAVESTRESSRLARRLKRERFIIDAHGLPRTRRGLPFFERIEGGAREFKASRSRIALPRCRCLVENHAGLTSHGRTKSVLRGEIYPHLGYLRSAPGVILLRAIATRPSRDLVQGKSGRFRAF